MSAVRRPFVLLPLSVALLLSLSARAEEAAALSAAAPEPVPAPAPAAEAAGDDGAAPVLDGVSVVAPRVSDASRGATGLSLRVKDTPQSVQSIDAAAVQKLGLDDVNSVLDLATGVNVERTETDRTYYNARGFDIKNFQVDGVGVPLHWSNVVGGLDSALYERVEIVRGANGLLVGTGNPSGAVNFIRKRPTGQSEGSVKTTIGSWDKRRIEADVSTPLSGSGNWSTRIVAAMQDAGSWLDNYENERSAMSAIVEGQLGAGTLLTAGYTDQRSNGTGALWGALPLLYSDGTPTDYDVSTSTTMDWTYYRTHSRTAFVELLQELPAGWEWKTTLTRNKYSEPSELFYVYGSPSPTTGLGLFGWPGKFFAHADRRLLDSAVSGDYELGGRRHELTVGVALARVDSGYLSYDAPPTDPAWGALPAFPGWDGSEIDRPDFGPGYVSADIEDRFSRLYAATRFSLTDDTKLIAGFNAVKVKAKGFSFGAPQDRDEEGVSPYLGVVHALDAQTSLYASYSDIFDPQVETDFNHRPLGSAKGLSYEAGVKRESANGRLLGTAALFRIEQENLAEVAGWDPSAGANYYRGTEVSSQGIELELAGHLAERWKIGSGYTWLEIRDDEGEDARNYVPRQTLKLSTSWRPAGLDRLEIGGTARWQDDIHTGTAPALIRQDAYGVLSAYVSYEPAPDLEVALNVDNLTDEKYLTSLYWDQSYYGEPLAVSGSVRFSF
ncbi:MAG: TonB-dependent siderophore receptor [Pseudomonadota bacterium]